MTSFFIEANLIDLHQSAIYPAKITVADGIIQSIEKTAGIYDQYLCCGFVDAHVHIESSMLTPANFAQLAVVHGSVATVSDPHEIANVLGLKGVQFMIDNGLTVPFKFCFGAPSCVPATNFETAGATLTAADIETLFKAKSVYYLAEMMNFPGVLYDDAIVYEKIHLAQKYGYPVDGHAPGLRGEQAKKYISAGISTDHECFTFDEAHEKLQYGMKILIREGSAAKNFEALAPLLHDNSDNMMFCSDDKHPDNLLEGHINELVKRALQKGVELFKVLRVACLNPVAHYKLPVGLLRVGDAADFILIDSPEKFNVLATYINGEKVAENGKSLLQSHRAEHINHFDTSLKTPQDFSVKAIAEKVKVNVIEALDGQLITNPLQFEMAADNGYLQADTSRDLLKIAVVNRYSNSPVAVGFIKNFGLKEGAIASSVAHDSHNIIVVGVSDEDLCKAANLLITAKGGIAATSSEGDKVLALPIAGIMTDTDGTTVGHLYATLDAKAKRMGSQLHAPYMSLSFMALLVIPSLKMSDLGLFDGQKFEFKALQEA